MTIAMTRIIERTGPAIRAVLAELDPEECERFEAEFHIATAETDDDFDTTRVTDLIAQWWARTMVLLNPDPEVDAIMARIRAGDMSDIGERWVDQADGNTHVYRKNPAGEWVFSHIMRPGQE